MHKNISVSIVSFLLLGVFTTLTAQNVEFKLGGKTNAEKFEIKDSDGTVLFQLKGNGKIGLGSAVLKSAKMHVQGSINAQGVYKIQGKTNLKTMDDGNLFVGKSAGKNTTLGTWPQGRYNTFLGDSAGYLNTTGYKNTFSGYKAGYSNNDGYLNTFNGYMAGYSNTAGWFNTFNGYEAGYSNTTGHSNTFNGYKSGFSNTAGFYNTFNGFRAGDSNTTGDYNTYNGVRAGYNNTTGNSNTFNGYQAGYLNVTGTGNVFLGNTAGYNETGSNLLYIDNFSTTSPLIWGDFSADSVRINGDLHVTGDFYVDGSMPAPSDIRYKTDVRPISNALTNLSSINGVLFSWNKEEYPDKSFNNHEQVGVIAQDLEKVYPQLVYTGKDGYKSVDYTKLTAVIIEATKEQQRIIDQLTDRVQVLEDHLSLAKTN